MIPEEKLCRVGTDNTAESYEYKVGYFLTIEQLIILCDIFVRERSGVATPFTDKEHIEIILKNMQ